MNNASAGDMITARSSGNRNQLTRRNYLRRFLLSSTNLDKLSAGTLAHGEILAVPLRKPKTRHFYFARLHPHKEIIVVVAAGATCCAQRLVFTRCPMKIVELRDHFSI